MVVRLVTPYGIHSELSGYMLDGAVRYLTAHTARPVRVFPGAYPPSTTLTPDVHPRLTGLAFPPVHDPLVIPAYWAPYW